MKRATVFEVGLRDGLQAENRPVRVDAKLAMADALVDAGLKRLEGGAFVHPKWVPQMADTDELWPKLAGGVDWTALVPNTKGLERALKAGAKHVALLTSATDAFAQKNLATTRDGALETLEQTYRAFREAETGGLVRAYISVAFECPYSGPVEPDAVTSIVDRLIRLGADEVVVSDTVGVAIPDDVDELEREVRDFAPLHKVAWHFHDTRGTAIACVAKALDLGYTTFDASAGGLGGCPFAPGAGGNLATEDLIYFLERSGYRTGVDLKKLARASLPVLKELERSPSSRAQQAVLAAER